MKTLDEVIKAFEQCNDKCYECAYHLGNSCIIKRNSDALHYLKAYKDDKDDLTALRAFWKEQQANPALTWEELKQMEGKPVWVEYDGYKPMWDIVDKIINERTIETYNCMLHNEGIGIYWQAYRKERK